MSYIIGLAVLAQTNSSGATSYLMVDGQGSTRQLTDSSGNITARFVFDAYGNLLYVTVGVLNLSRAGRVSGTVFLRHRFRRKGNQAAGGRGK